MAASPPEAPPGAHRASPRGRPGALAAGLVAAAAWGSAPLPVAAQELARPTLEGRVLRGDSSAVSDIPVVLHRVGPDSAGEAGAVRSGPDGRFTLALPSVPDPGGRREVYFASVEYQGVLYFGPAVAIAVQLDSTYAITVYDTVSAAPGGQPLPVAVRYLVLEEASEGEGWQVTDLFVVRNAGTRTVVPREGDVAWAYPLPPGARDVQVGGGDLDPGAATARDGTLSFAAPVAPGDRQMVIRYRIEGTGLELPMPGRTEEVELLVREPAPPLEVTGLTPASAVEMEAGTTYRRYHGAGLDDVGVEVREADEEGASPAPLLAVLLALVLGGAGIWAVQRGRPGVQAPRVAGPAGDDGPGVPGAVPGDRDRTILEIARIDERLDGGAVDDEERARLRDRRAELVALLSGTG